MTKPGKSEQTVPHRTIEKDCWPLYSLQSLPPGRFVKVVSKIIDGRCQLLSARFAELQR